MKREINLKIGEKIGLSHDGRGHTYRTLLEDITHEGYFVVSVPLYRGIPVIFRREQEIELYYYRENGQFGIFVIVRDIIAKDAMRYLVLDQVSEPWKLQRREFFRMPVSLPAKIKHVIVTEMQSGGFNGENADDLEWLPVTTNNLSEQGASLKTTKKVAPGERLKVRFSLAKRSEDFTEPVEAICIVRQAELVDAMKNIYLLGVEFADCSEDTRRKIAKFIFKQQQHMRLIRPDDDS